MRDTLKPRRWHLSASIIILVVLSLVVMAGVVGGFVLWSTTNSDARALQRQTLLVSHFLDEQLAAMPESQQTNVIWDDAVQNTSESFNETWVDANLGMNMWHENFYEQAIVLDDGDEPIYMMSGGAEVDPGLFADDLKTLAPLIAKERQRIAGGAIRAYAGGATEDLPAATDLLVISGAPAMVSIMPIVSDSGELTPAPGEDYLHVVVDFLDAEFADFVAGYNLLENASFRSAVSGNPDNAAYPMINSSGRIVAFFEWQQDRPGHRMLTETVPALGAALLLGAGLIVLLLIRIARYSAEIETGRMKAQHQAHHDVLTGLPNRAYFEEWLAKAAARKRGDKFALMLLDLDRFKQVNDTLGHPAGDELIRMVGQRLQGIVSSSGIIARLGGDEFGLLENPVGGEDAAETLAARIVETIGKPFDLFGNEASVGVSIGIVLAAGGNANAAELTRKADIALYEAKAEGRNRAIVYEDRMDEGVQQRHLMEADLREALRRPDQLAVVFEPLMTATGKIVGAEASAVWNHPRLGEVPPARFMAIAETSALIEPLGEMVLRKACQLGARHPGQTVSVNVARAQLRNPKFFTRIFDILAETGMRPADLEVEIAEEFFLKDQDTAGEALRKLHTAGIRIAVDDFGTGYSSLNFLKQFHIDRIKVGQSVGGQSPDARVAVAIVQAMMTLAHSMGIEVTAKGVDRQDQMTQLTGLGCRVFQGPFLAPAASMDALEVRLQRERGREKPQASSAA